MNLKTLFVLIAAVGISNVSTVLADTGHVHDEEHGLGVTQLLMPIMNSSRGMSLFVDKGCVACHAVNGVGGHDASPLDAHNMEPYMNPFDLAAKMWMMAPYMIAAQEEAFGEQIHFSGAELADIIAFLHDDLQQHEFGEHNLTPKAMEMMNHSHGETSAVDEHAESIGHSHEEGEDHD